LDQQLALEPLVLRRFELLVRLLEPIHSLSRLV